MQLLIVRCSGDVLGTRSPSNSWFRTWRPACFVCLNPNNKMPKKRLCSQIMLVAHVVSYRVWIMCVTARVRWVTQEPEMRKPELKRITAMLRQLSPVQRKIVANELAALDAQPAVTVIVEGRFACGAMCQRCESKRVIRHGHANGLQRYRCRECGKTFNALSGTPLNRLHKRDKWLQQAEALQDGQTLRKVARTLNIHLSTAPTAGAIVFWRHPSLSSRRC